MKSTISFALSAAVLLWGTLLLQPSRAAASMPEVGIVITSVEREPKDATSAQYKETLETANTKWKNGDTTGSIALLDDVVSSGPPSDAAAAKLRLAYMHHKLGDKELAKSLFAQVASIPEGINELARGDAAFRFAHLEPREERRALYERILAGDYTLSNYDSSEVSLLLAAMCHADLDLQKAVSYYDAADRMSGNLAQRVESKTELAGLWFELAKGEGTSPIPESERADAYDRSRAYCQQVMNLRGSASQTRVMVADLMFFETYYFQGNYETSYQHGTEFLGHWGNVSAQSYSPRERIYINTARTFHLLSCYLTGRRSETRTLADDLIASPPKPAEEFPLSDGYMNALVVRGLLAEEDGDTAKAAELQSLGEQKSAAYYRDIRNDMLRKRAVPSSN